MKYIFVTGGVISSLGKGLTAAALGALLECRGLKVRIQKFDPYLNVDPGTMSPYQHGEVYVLDDGSETDLDLGHYERFTSGTLNRDSNYTTGQIYLRVIEKERHGLFLGKTVQVIPHITNEIRDAILRMADASTDIVITEIGGTVGDIEGLPFLEAIRQFPLAVGRENCLFIHLTLVPYLKAAAEIKTKPTQHSVGQLRQIGIQPDMLICRCEQSISREEREKIALFCNVPLEAVIEEKDRDFSIYEVPLSLRDHRLDEFITKRFGFVTPPPKLDSWDSLMYSLRNPKHEVSIAVVGKYAEHKDAYKSIYESIDHAGIHHQTSVRVARILSSDIEQEGPERLLSGYDGILIPGGFGERGIEGKLQAIRYARQREIPFFGICLGMQCAAIEFGRSIVGLNDAHSTEFNKDTPHPVICLLDEQKNVTDLGGTMRLGAQPCQLIPNSLAHQAYQLETISERHRHRYEFNNIYRSQFEAHGMRFSGLSPDASLVEILELPSHPFFLAVQFHPEFKSKPTKAHPLFAKFIAAALERRSVRKSKLPSESETQKTDSLTS